MARGRMGTTVPASEALDAWRHVRRAFADHRDLRLSAALVAAALALFLGFGAWAEAEAPAFVAWHFDLSRDHSAAEFFGYVLSGLTAAFLALAWWRSGLSLYAAFALLFLFVLADDALQYHEGFARHVLKPLLDIPRMPGGRIQDTAEVLAWGIAAVALAVPLLLALRQWAAGKTGLVLTLAVPIGMLGAFGVGADVLHSMVPPSRLDTVIGIAEDGGELIALSLAACLSAALARAPYGSAYDPPLVWRGLRAQVATRPERARDPLRRALGQPDLHAVAPGQAAPPQGLLRGGP